jgi:hypothetical protein
MPYSLGGGRSCIGTFAARTTCTLLQTSLCRIELAQLKVSSCLILVALFEGYHALSSNSSIESLRQGPCGGGPFCDHPSGPQQYFPTKLPTEIQFLGSRPAEIPVFVNFARHEVCTVSLSRHYCNSTLGYGRQVLMPTKKKKSPPADRRRFPTMAFGRWISTTNIDQYLAYALID